MPAIAIEIPICVMEVVVWNSRIMAGMVGRYMSLTNELNAPMIAINATKTP